MERPGLLFTMLDPYINHEAILKATLVVIARLHRSRSNPVEPENEIASLRSQ